MVREIKKQEAAFVAELVPAARASQQSAGVPASITIAQAIQESGWGKTRLAREDFNYFGIKAVPGHDYCRFETAEYLNGKKELMEAHFARYHSAAESFRAHAYLLSHLARYAPAMRHAGSAVAFALALQQCGYSTDPAYADKLMDLVDEFHLTQYDAPPSPPDEPAKAKRAA